MFCAPRLIFGGSEGVWCRFIVLRARTDFRRYRGRPVPFLCFALPDSFSALLRASAPVFMFYAPWLVSRGTEGVRSRFHVLRSRLIFDGNKGVGSRFCATGVVSCDTEGVGTRFEVLRSCTRFWWY
jgi:hypothetical protein